MDGYSGRPNSSPPPGFTRRSSPGSRPARGWRTPYPTFSGFGTPRRRRPIPGGTARQEAWPLADPCYSFPAPSPGSKARAAASRRPRGASVMRHVASGSSEGDHVAKRLRAREEHRQPVQPKAIPPCGGAPNSSASRRNPNFTPGILRPDVSRSNIRTARPSGGYGCSPPDLRTVQHHVVRLGADLPGSVEAAEVLVDRAVNGWCIAPHRFSSCPTRGAGSRSPTAGGAGIRRSSRAFPRGGGGTPEGEHATSNESATRRIRSPGFARSPPAGRPTAPPERTSQGGGQPRLGHLERGEAGAPRSSPPLRARRSRSGSIRQAGRGDPRITPPRDATSQRHGSPSSTGAPCGP